jgi:hypothetical protein
MTVRKQVVEKKKNKECSLLPIEVWSGNKNQLNTKVF